MVEKDFTAAGIMTTMSVAPPTFIWNYISHELLQLFQPNTLHNIILISLYKYYSVSEIGTQPGIISYITKCNSILFFHFADFTNQAPMKISL